MARIVLACWGSFGDLFPYLGLADRLQALGHTPVIACCAYHQALIEKEGFAFRPLRPDVTPDDTATIARVMDPKHGSEVVLRELVLPAARDAYADLIEATRGADLLVSHPITFTAPLVAEKRQLPWVSSVLSPVSFFSVHDFPVMPNAPALVHLRRLGLWASRLQLKLARRVTNPWMEPIRTLRAELGLLPAGAPLFEGQFSPFGTIAMFSRQLGAPQPDWPSRSHVTGFSFFNRAIPMPDALSNFLDGGDPPIVFTLGSSAVGAAGTFFQESAKAAVRLKRRAVLLVGRNPDNLPRDLPPGVIAVDSAPHDRLFPRAAVIVHQGGVGTTGQAMRSGRPQLVVPHAHDQPDNAFRVKNLGIARVLYPTRYVASRVVTHVRALLDDPRYAERANVVGRGVRTENGAAGAVDVILSALGSRG
jgi:UDP:flavonoid glycosyltransferase YjiC (YdhE family)